MLYCFHTAGLLHIFMLYNLLGPGISLYRRLYIRKDKKKGRKIEENNKREEKKNKEKKGEEKKNRRKEKEEKIDCMKERLAFYRRFIIKYF